MKDIVKFLIVDIIDEKEAYELEKQEIKKLGIDNLVNYSLGGEGASGGIHNPAWNTQINKEELDALIKANKSLCEIKKIFNFKNGDILRLRYYPDKTFFEYAKSINPLYDTSHIKIKEENYLSLLRKGKTNKQICLELNCNINMLKQKFYKNSTLKEYCAINNIPYTNTQQKETNGNYKIFDTKRFEKLVKEKLSLTKIAKHLELSPRCLIIKYRDYYKVSSWKELCKKLIS